MPGLVIDAEMLILALEEQAGEVEWHLSLSTGEVVPLIDSAITGDSSAEEDPERDPPRYLAIEPIPSSRAFAVMEAFVESLPPGATATSLSASLRRRHPFRAFKDAFLDVPFVREQWFRFHDREMRSLAERWLRENHVVASLSPQVSGSRKA